MTLVDDLKNTTMAQVIRNVAVVVTLISPVWFFSKNIVHAYAQEAFVNALKDAGVNPEVVKALIDKVDNTAHATDNLKVDLTNLSNDIDSVKKQNDHLIGQQDKMKQKNDETYELVQKLLDLRLNETQQ
jgi:peptidoglycan hydrolase CwlO-like protein